MKKGRIVDFAKTIIERSIIVMPDPPSSISLSLVESNNIQHNDKNIFGIGDIFKYKKQFLVI